MSEPKKNKNKQLDFIDHEAANDSFASVEVDLALVVKSWRDSVFSFQWLTAEGAIKSPEDLSDDDKEKRAQVEKAIKDGTSIKKPVLGIGLQEHIEIGSGRAELLTLAALNYKSMPAHIPKSNLDDFEKFLIKD